MMELFSENCYVYKKGQSISEKLKISARNIDKLPFDYFYCPDAPTQTLFYYNSEQYDDSSQT